MIRLPILALLITCFAAPATAPEGEPDRIRVQHVLVAFEGRLPGKTITRSGEEARALAYDLLKRARAGEDFEALVRAHSDDRPPGIYGMSNHGIDPQGGELARGRMVRSFGDVAFKLKVGEIGIADYNPRDAPYGYHVIKRLE